MAGFVTRGRKVGLAPANRAVIASTVDIFVNGLLAGFVTQMTSNHTRNVERIRNLSIEDAGRIVEQSPMPEDVTLNVTGFALYNSAEATRKLLLNRISVPFGDATNRDSRAAAAIVCLNEQHIPFDVVRRAAHPLPPGSIDNTAQNIAYIGCLLTTYSYPVNIGAATISETAAVSVAHVEPIVGINTSSAS